MAVFVTDVPNQAMLFTILLKRLTISLFYYFDVITILRTTHYIISCSLRNRFVLFHSFQNLFIFYRWSQDLLLTFPSLF